MIPRPALALGLAGLLPFLFDLPRSFPPLCAR